MAIVRGAGTEIIRTIHYEDVDSGTYDLIVGEQHHIYTILSVIINCVALQASGNAVNMWIIGYDSKGGTTAQYMNIFNEAFGSIKQTFVWNDKFSMNGFEPTDFTGPMDDATKQNAIADQGSSVAQKLQLSTSHADDNFEVTCTYIDQNNA